jgi:hypothetical protein
MAFGINQVSVAVPQPGTSNLPIATTKKKGGLAGLFGGSTTLPPFVPVAVNVVDNYGSAVVEQTAKYTAAVTEAALLIKGITTTPNGGTLTAIDTDLAAIAKTLARVADNKKVLADLLINLNIAVAAAVVAKNNETANLNVTAVNTIKSNNYYMATSTVQPVLPPIEDQIKEALDDAKSFITAASLLGFINTTINSITFGITSYIVGTEAYKTVTAKFEEFKQSVFSVFAPSIAAVKETTESLSGAKGP